jgi:hypothetical protein
VIEPFHVKIGAGVEEISNVFSFLCANAKFLFRSARSKNGKLDLFSGFIDFSRDRVCTTSWLQVHRIPLIVANKYCPLLMINGGDEP